MALAVCAMWHEVCESELLMKKETAAWIALIIVILVAGPAMCQQAIKENCKDEGGTFVPSSTCVHPTPTPSGVK